MTYREALKNGETLLCKGGISDAKTDAWLLLSWVCGIDRNFYYLHMQEDLEEEKQSLYEAALKKRTSHIPLQYITGEQEFMGLPFLVNPDVLIPRQDTEILVEEALKWLKPEMSVLDLCTGSGCIIISVLKNMPKVRGTAADISGRALLVAKENAKLNGVTPTWIESDLFFNIKESYDMILSNPPYIPTEEIKRLMPEVRDYEPNIALDGSGDGLLFYRNIISEGKRHLHPKGRLMFEVGCDQSEAVSALMAKEGYTQIETRKDLAGYGRVVTGVLGGKHV